MYLGMSEALVVRLCVGPEWNCVFNFLLDVRLTSLHLSSWITTSVAERLLLNVQFVGV